MFKVYISYRRQDSGDIARRIYQYLEKDLGQSVVFKDDKIPPGAEWHSFLRETLDTADVLIVVIGPDWLTAPRNNQPRLFEPGDFHRSEIETALNSGKLVVPVIVNNAEMPTPADLPDSIRDLYERMSIRVRNEPNFKADLAKLGDYLRQTLGIEPTKEKTSPKNDNSNDKEDERDSHRLQIILAIIGLISAAVVALITVSPALLALLLPTPTPTTISSPADTPTATDKPGTPIVLTQLDMTATEAMLQLTVDARATENALLLATNTQIAVQTQTGTAQILPPTTVPAPSDTPASSGGDAVVLTIFRSEDSFTLYVPRAEDTLSLVGLEFRVTLMNGETISRRLDRDFAGFLGIPFENINTLGAVCFHITRAGGFRPVPQTCQSGVLLLSQEVAEADAFWRDFSAQLARTVLLYWDDQLMGTCAPQASCAVNWRDVSEPAAVTATQTPGYPCEATIIFRSGGMSQVKMSPLRGAPNTTPVQQGSRVHILDKRTNDAEDWYQVLYESNTGWITTDLVELSEMCPK